MTSWLIVGGAGAGSVFACVFAPTSPEHPAASKTAPAAATRLRFERFNDDRDPLSAADAGRAEAIALARSLQGVDQMGDDARARRRERVAQRDRAAVDVQLVPIDAERALDGAH